MGPGHSHLHFRDTIYVDSATISGVILRFEDTMGADQQLSEVLRNAESQMEIGKAWP
jgi:hypothetical protein